MSAAEGKTAPVEKFRKDYTRPSYLIPEVQLDVRIFDGETKIETVMDVQLNREVAAPGADFHLDGEGVKLEAAELLPRNGEGVQALVEGKDYELTSEGLVIKGLKEETFKLRTRVSVVPETNTQLSGLYYSGSTYSTQMEAEGFRRMTFFPDRPDVMSKYTRVRLEANKEKCPVLLSNGNRLEDGPCPDDASRHFAVFQDPHAKPCYLFALVAGPLKGIESSFTTASGRNVRLALFSEPHNVDQLDHAMRSVKNAMKWDEDRFGLEYDLDVFNIVAVQDFNMGAMENKGLNIFNTACVLARTDTSTDNDFERVEGVVGHEYFHNWTGNRVTCQDWFQLTLKEGLTVFRDQEFSAAMGSAAVKRIDDVRILRSNQFPEDAGPMSHPIRPESYIAMDNFYTATVYEKGAEVVRMYQTLLGRDGFRKGMDLYFKRHDGQAVSCDDFRAAMADANGKDLTQFEEWYLQPGTPQVEIRSSFDAATGVYSLTMKQKVGAGQAHLPQEKRREKPLHIPVAVGLLEAGTGKEVVPTKVLELTQAEQTFTFEGLKAEPVPSLLRNYSAPVKVDYPYTDDDLAFLAAYDTDSFNRWESAQELATKAIKQVYEAPAGQAYQLPAGVGHAFKRILNDKETDDLSLLAFALMLPTHSALMGTVAPPIDPVKLHEARFVVRRAIHDLLKEDLLRRYQELTPEKGAPMVIDGPNIGKRRLRNVCLGFLMAPKDDAAIALASEHFWVAKERGCMTDKITALTLLLDVPDDERSKKATQAFFEDAKGLDLVLDKWFTAQALADVPDVIERVERLCQHPDFSLKNPNRLRSVVSAFTQNVGGFHKADGSGYAFIGKMVGEVDKLNPQVASRLAKSMSIWPKLDAQRQTLIKEQVAKLHEKSAELSPDTFETVKLASKAN